MLVCAGSWNSSGAFPRNKDHHKPAGLSQGCVALLQPSPARRHGHTETSSASPALSLLQNLNSQPKHPPCCPPAPPPRRRRRSEHTHGRRRARCSVRSFRVLRYSHQELSSLTQMRPAIFRIQLLSKNALSRQNS